MLQIRILLTAVALVVGCTVAGGQDKSKAPGVTLTGSPDEIAVPLQFNRACTEGYYQRNPKVGRMEAPVILKAAAVNMGGSVRYVYSVTGGTIEGEGSSVTWILAGLPAGTHSATVEATNGRGVTTLDTTTVTISTFHCEWEWFNFSAAISCPDSVAVGEPATFSVKVERGPPDAEIGFEWTVSAGRIKSGQGTHTITVDTSGVEGPITANLKLCGVPSDVRLESTCTVMVTAHRAPTNEGR